MNAKEFLTYAKQYCVDDSVKRVLSQAMWANEITDAARAKLREDIQECSELTFVSLLMLLDGVGGNLDGVFELVHASSNGTRTLLNPQNTEMLHDTFYDIRTEA